MDWSWITTAVNWIRAIDWDLLQTLLGMVIAVFGFFAYKKYRHVVLRLLLRLQKKRDECALTIPLHTCMVLNREREMVIKDEAQPCFELINLLEEAGVKVNVIHSNKESHLDEIHVGGPVSNRHTNRYFCRYIQNIKWVATPEHVAQYKSDKNLSTFNDDYLQLSDGTEGFWVDGEMLPYIKDKEGWAFIARINLAGDAEAKTIHLLFGCGTNGTIGATNFFINNYSYIWHRNMKRDDYIGVFRVDKDGNKTGEIRWLDVHKFIRK